MAKDGPVGADGKKLKPCCACPETKRPRDACIVEKVRGIAIIIITIHTILILLELILFITILFITILIITILIITFLSITLPQHYHHHHHHHHQRHHQNHHQNHWNLDQGEENCGDLIEAHKACMRGLGFKI